MKVKIDDFVIEFPDDGLDKIDAPNVEGETKIEEVYANRKLEELKKKLDFHLSYVL